MSVVGARFLIEAGFIIAVAVVAVVERLGTLGIILVVAAAWLVVAIAEIVVRARQGALRQAGRAAQTRPLVAPQPDAPAEVVRPDPLPEETVEPEPLWERPRIAAVPAPPPEPQAEPERAPEGVLAFTPANDAPREWNLWELERAARDHGGDDVAQAEERSYLLMYLREFAGPDGVLPADFDGLVRDAFGDVLQSVGA